MRINIATALDDNYIRYTYVMLVSLLENQNPDDEIYAYILHAGIKQENIVALKELEEKYHSCKMIFMLIDENTFGRKLLTKEGWPMATYYRLLLPDIIDEDIDRLLYLDGDIVVNSSLREVYFSDFEGNILCACEDCTGQDTLVSADKIAKIVYESGRKYFNAGFLLWDFARWKKEYSLNVYMLKLGEIEDYLYALDQDILNYTHVDETKILDNKKYNLFAKVAFSEWEMKCEEIEKSATVIHYATQKPWMGEYVHCDNEKIWWKYAKLSPYYDELINDFMDACLGNPHVYDLVTKLIYENKRLSEEVKLRTELNDKLLSIIEGK